MHPGRRDVGPLPLCARCPRPHDSEESLAAFVAGYTSSLRELHGAEPFALCAACVRSEAHEVYRTNVAHWSGLGASPGEATALLQRPR